MIIVRNNDFEASFIDSYLVIGDAKEILDSDENLELLQERFPKAKLDLESTAYKYDPDGYADLLRECCRGTIWD